MIDPLKQEASGEHMRGVAVYEMLVNKTEKTGRKSKVTSVI